MFCNIGLKVVNRCWFFGWNVFCGWLGAFVIGLILDQCWLQCLHILAERDG